MRVAAALSLLCFLPLRDGALAEDAEPRALVRELQKALKGAPYAERIEVYGKLAAPNEDVEPPLALVTQELAKGLLDEAFFVREHCLALMLKHQDPDSAVKGWLKAHDQLEKDWKRIEKRLVFLGQNGGTGDRGKPGFQEEDQRDLNASQLHFASFYKALARVPDARVEKALVGAMKTDLNKMPGFLFLLAATGCMEMGTPKAMAAVAQFVARAERKLDKGKLKQRIPSERTWVGNKELQRYAELRPSNLQKAVEKLRVWSGELEEPLREPALKALEQREWDEWLEVIELALAPSPGRLTKPVQAELKPHPPGLLEFMKPDWKWN